jgi:hypothetical protein
LLQHVTSGTYFARIRIKGKLIRESLAPHLAAAGLRLVSAHVLAGELGVGAYPPAEIAATVRRELIGQREGFVIETVF